MIIVDNYKIKWTEVDFKDLSTFPEKDKEVLGLTRVAYYTIVFFNGKTWIDPISRKELPEDVIAMWCKPPPPPKAGRWAESWKKNGYV